MTFNYLRREPASYLPASMEDDSMAGIQAGVVAGADLYSQPSQPSGWTANLGSPATWVTIEVGVAVLYLVGIYIGAIRIAGRSA